MSRAYFKGVIPEKQVFRGQAALIVAAMATATSADTAKTTMTIAKEIEKDLTTRQDPERVVAFYMSVWKKKGWVRAVDVGGPDSVPEPVNSIQDEVGGVHADDHMAAKMEAEVEAAHTPSLPDLKGRKLSEAVVEVLKFLGVASTPEKIVATLNSHGYEFQLNQVNSAIQNLFKKELITKTALGSVELVVA